MRRGAKETPQAVSWEAVLPCSRGRGCCVLLQQRAELLLGCYGNQVLGLISY